jgi:hypothetical protein
MTSRPRHGTNTRFRSIVSTVMPALVAGIHVFSRIGQGVDGAELGPARARHPFEELAASPVNRTCGDKPGHDDGMVRNEGNTLQEGRMRKEMSARTR